MTQPDSPFVAVAKVGEIPEGKGGTFVVGDRMVAVFNVQGRYFAIDDLCPHMGASLGAGELTDDTVMCPWHAWRFRVTDGTWCDNPKVATKVFDVRVEDGMIWVCQEPRPKAK